MPFQSSKKVLEQKSMVMNIFQLQLLLKNIGSTIEFIKEKKAHS